METDSNSLSDKILHLKEKYPNRYPLIVKESDIKLKKYKFLIPQDLSLYQLVQVFRSQNTIEPTEAIYMFFINGKDRTTFPQTINIRQVYEQMNNNGVLYLILKKENTFGY